MDWRIKKGIAERSRNCVLCDAEYLAFSRIARSPFCPDCKTPQLQKEEKRYFAQIGRTERANAPMTLTLHQWIVILDHFDWKCAYCNGSFDLMEHIVSISKGGGTTFENVVPACHKCNARKDHYDPPFSGIILPQEVARVQQKLQELWLV